MKKLKKTYALKIGDSLIADILNPQPEDMDLAAVAARLRVVHRFSNDPGALTVHVHRTLVRLVGEAHNASKKVLRWCYHHDDHEAITGDIPGPLKGLIA